HIATQDDWGQGNAAVNINGSAYHMEMGGLSEGCTAALFAANLCPGFSGGSESMSIQSDAVIFPADITIIKDATPNGATLFPFTTTAPAGAPALGSFSLTDNGTTANTRQFTNIINFGNYGVTETPIPSGWSLGSISCVEAAGGDNGTNP